MFIYQLGKFLGSVTIFFYALTVLNYVVKYVNKHFRQQLKKNDSAVKIFNFLLKIIVKNHRLFGFITIGALVSHFLIQFNLYGLNLSGALAALMLLLQVGLGVYGVKTKQRGGTWLLIHRSIAVIILVAILNHVL